MQVVDAVAYFTTAERRHTSYPVVDEQGLVVGEITRADSLAWTLEDEDNARPLGEMVTDRELFVGYPDELASPAADRMALTGVGRLPLVERPTGPLVGLEIGRASSRVRGCQ